MRTVLSFFAITLSLACGAPEPSPTTPSDPPPTPGETPAAPTGLSAADCAAKGGKVVGDIGDGAIHRPEYRCPGSGEAPLGAVVADPGGPVAIEGAVCCK